jgi:hypothetical protein
MLRAPPVLGGSGLNAGFPAPNAAAPVNSFRYLIGKTVPAIPLIHSAELAKSFMPAC